MVVRGVRRRLLRRTAAFWESTSVEKALPESSLLAALWSREKSGIFLEVVGCPPGLVGNFLVFSLRALHGDH